MRLVNSHHTPQAVLLGLEGLIPLHCTTEQALIPSSLAGSDPETIDTGTIPSRYADILQNKSLFLAGHHRISYDMDRDMLWRWDQVLKTHPNGMRFSCFAENGDLLATNEYFSVGGGFVVNDKTKGAHFHPGILAGRADSILHAVDENLFYKGVDKKSVHGARLHQSHSLSDPEAQSMSSPDPKHPTSKSPGAEDNVHPPYPFDSGDTLLALTKKHNVRAESRSDFSMVINDPNR